MNAHPPHAALSAVLAAALPAGRGGAAGPGAAISRFDDRSDGGTYLYTLLVPSDANLLFPCLDQPDLKARFRWRLSAPPGWRVLANARPESRDSAAAAVSWTFAETEPIPTY